jgi:uncharacterized protein
MIGTALNGLAIVAGAILGRATRWNLSPQRENQARFFLGLFLIYAGLSATWNAIHGTLIQVTGQVFILLLALVLGNLIGKLIGLQKSMNQLGRQASHRLSEATQKGPPPFGDAFVTCAIIFCIGPMALLGALQEGWTGSFRTLGVKAVMDGLATLTLARMFGWGAGLAALPVVAFQGTITLLARAGQPFLRDHALLDSLAATNGLLILCLSLVVFDLKKVPVGDYLPALLVAPLLTWLWL